MTTLTRDERQDRLDRAFDLAARQKRVKRQYAIDLKRDQIALLKSEISDRLSLIDYCQFARDDLLSELDQLREESSKAAIERRIKIDSNLLTIDLRLNRYAAEVKTRKLEISKIREAINELQKVS
ncbi:MAG: hypothetical protein ACYTFW_00625 [Planctomycetota bacterium]|jgi:hypothetical protein